MQDLEEKLIKREKIYKGKVLDVVKDTVELPNGRTSTREFCMHIGAVAVLPLCDDGNVIMERQYRHAHGRVILEIPAGKLNFKDEDRQAAAARELKEETGAVAERWTDLGTLITTPAIIDEKIQLFLAEGIKITDRELDEDEFINVEAIPLTELYRAVMSGEIQDSKTQVCVLKAAAIKGIKL